MTNWVLCLFYYSSQSSFGCAVESSEFKHSTCILERTTTHEWHDQELWDIICSGPWWITG